MHFLNRLDNGNVDRTITILGKLSSILEKWILEGSIKAETLYGVELLNEPRGWDEPIWAKCRDYFYPNGYKMVRSFFNKIEDSKRPWVIMQSAFRYLVQFCMVLKMFALYDIEVYSVTNLIAVQFNLALNGRTLSAP